MRHAPLGMAAMCHCLLPSASTAPPPLTLEDRSRYVDTAFDDMLSFFLRAGIAADQIEIKLFGGADVLQVFASRSVGRDNLAAARQFLDRKGMRLISFDTGGQSGRKIIFDTDRGTVLVRRLRPNSEQTLFAPELLLLAPNVP